jgi:hypothetical protein
MGKSGRKEKGRDRAVEEIGDRGDRGKTYRGKW